MSEFLAAANAAVEAGIARAREVQVRVSVVVLDRTMTPVSMQRMDGSYPSSVEVARAKANTALNFGAPTAVLAERIVPVNQAALASVVPQLMFIAGGVPIRANGELLGSVGVSGASADQDRDCAEAAAGALTAALGG
jgi:uncharacterized protein GlcG (DUF336 family)